MKRSGLFKKIREVWDKRNNMSVTFKIGVLTFLIASTMAVSTSFLLIVQYNKAIMKRAEINIQEYTRVMADRISSIFDEGILCSNNIVISISSISNNHSLKQTEELYILNSLNQNVLIFPGIDSIVYIDQNDKVYVTNEMLKANQEQILNSLYVQELEGTKGATIVLDKSDSCMSYDGKEYVTLGKEVRNINTGKRLGKIFINIDEEHLIRSSKSDLSVYMLADASGNYVISEEIEEPYITGLIEKILQDQVPETYEIKGEKYMVATEDFETCDWILVGITNVDRYNVSKAEHLSFLMFTASVSIVLCLIAMMISSGFIAKPIRKLSQGAKRIAEGDLSFRFHFKTNDEIGKYADTFNYMMDQNQQLLYKVNEQSTEKRKYELSLLQEQIKPHFLYNTLDIIIMLIHMQREKEAERVTRKLASYYKNSLSGSEEIITVEKEIHIIRDYLDLQNIRYAEKFTFDIHIPMELSDLLIPKLTLQPIVENAIYHGIKQKEGMGHITITGQGDQKTNTFRLIVEDNGNGMEACVLENIRKELLGKELRKGVQKTIYGSNFGIYNTHNRIRLYFGEQYGLSLESEIGEGTQVTIWLPQRRVLE